MSPAVCPRRQTRSYSRNSARAAPSSTMVKQKSRTFGMSLSAVEALANKYRISMADHIEHATEDTACSPSAEILRAAAEARAGQAEVRAAEAEARAAAAEAEAAAARRRALVADSRAMEAYGARLDADARLLSILGSMLDSGYVASGGGQAELQLRRVAAHVRSGRLSCPAQVVELLLLRDGSPRTERFLSAERVARANGRPSLLAGVALVRVRFRQEPYLARLTGTHLGDDGELCMEIAPCLSPVAAAAGVPARLVVTSGKLSAGKPTPEEVEVWLDAMPVVDGVAAALEALADVVART